MRYKAWQDLLREVCCRTGIPLHVLRSRQRHPALTAARALAVRELRAAGYSLPQIGRILGGRHHTTILYLYRHGGSNE